MQSHLLSKRIAISSLPINPAKLSLNGLKEIKEQQALVLAD